MKPQQGKGTLTALSTLPLKAHLVYLVPRLVLARAGSFPAVCHSVRLLIRSPLWSFDGTRCGLDPWRVKRHLCTPVHIPPPEKRPVAHQVADILRHQTACARLDSVSQ